METRSKSRTGTDEQEQGGKKNAVPPTGSDEEKQKGEPRVTRSRAKADAASDIREKAQGRKRKTPGSSSERPTRKASRTMSEEERRTTRAAAAAAAVAEMAAGHEDADEQQEIDMAELQHEELDRPGSALQGLLRRLGQGLDDLFPTHGVSQARMKSILTCLRSAADDIQKSKALSELCDVLSVGSEESLVSLSVDGFVPIIIGCLGQPNSPETMLLAARALTHMMDALPASSSSIAHHGAAGPLCESLLAIEYMDLAEQSIAALEKLTADYPQPVVRAGGFAAALPYFEFFSLGVQRSAAAIVSNMCRNPPPDAFEDMIEPQLTSLRQLLDNDDQRIREHAATALWRLAESNKNNSDRLNKLAGGDQVMLVDQAVTLLTWPPPPKLSTNAFAAILRLLSVLTRGSSQLSAYIMQQKQLLESLKTLLSDLSGHLQDALGLVDSLLPEPPTSAADAEDGNSARRRRRRSFPSSTTVLAVENERRKSLEENPDLLVDFASLFFGELLQGYSSFNSSTCRRSVMSILQKTLVFAPTTVLEKLLPERSLIPGVDSHSRVSFSSFVAGLLGENASSNEMLAGLFLVQSAMDRALDLVKTPFAREGVFHELERIAAFDTNLPVQPDGASPSETVGQESLSAQAPSAAQIAHVQKAAEAARKASRTLSRFSQTERDSLVSLSELDKLVNISKDLQAHGLNDPSPCSPLTRLAALLASPRGVSTFEFTRSMLVGALLEYIMADDPDERLNRLRDIHVTFVSEPNAFSEIVARLIGMIACDERLPVIVNESNSGSAVSVNSSLRQLIQPIRLRLKRSDAEENKQLGDLSHNTIMIDPLATISSIHDYIWPRVQSRGPAGSGDAGPSSANTGTDELEDDEEAEEARQGLLRDYEDAEFFDVEENAEDEGDEDDDDGDDDDDDDGVEEVGDADGSLGLSGELSRSLPAVELDLDKPTGRSPLSQERERSRSTASPRSYAAAVNNRPAEHSPNPARGESSASVGSRPSKVELDFYMNGLLVEPSRTILQAALRAAGINRSFDAEGQPVKPLNSRVWDETYILTYGLVGVKPGSECTAEKDSENEVASSRKPSFMDVNDGPKVQLPDAMTSPCLGSPKLRDTLSLLSVFYWLVEHGNEMVSNTGLLESSLPGISVMDFLSRKINTKLMRQLSDPLALSGSTIPEWCFVMSKELSFLLPFDSRVTLLRSSSLGVGRALQNLQTRMDASSGGDAPAPSRSNMRTHDHETRISRMQRQKVRIHRRDILDSAKKALDMYASHKTILEIEYFNEAGTGLGPTLEFYTIVSRDLQRTEMGMWLGKTSVPVSKVPERQPSRTDVKGTKKSGAPTRGKSAPQHVVASGDGLYPISVSPGSQSKQTLQIIENFNFLGKFMAKALLDGRHLDIRLATEFYEDLLCLIKSKREGLLELPTPSISGTGLKLLRNIDPVLHSSLRAIMDLTDDEDAISNLCLNFVLPGNEKIELCPNGKSKALTSDNVEEYVRATTVFMRYTGVRRQINAFAAGFESVLNLESLTLFSASELDLLFCGPSFEKWTTEFLVQAIKCDHGFTHESDAVRGLLDILSKFSADDQRRFLLFTTGAPRLPVGGLKELRPRLTIVKRTSEPGRSPDESLPTVMTCTNYLKLPDYSSPAVTKERLMYAILEGQGSFHLS